MKKIYQLICFILVIVPQICSVDVHDEVTNQSNSLKLVHKRIKRYSVVTSTFMRSNHLTYRIVSYSKRINDSTVDEITAKAFKVWTDRSGLVIQKKRFGKVDIEIGFYSKGHGGKYEFDGEGGQLSYSNITNQSSVVYFDDDENWSLRHIGFLKRQPNLFVVEIHEIGHGLGLNHTTVFGSVMNSRHGAFYSDSILSKDDVNGIQALYGPKPILKSMIKKFEIPYDQTLKSNETRPEICKIGRIEAIVSNKIPSGLLIFSKNKCFKINENKSKQVSDFLPEIKGKIVAAFYYLNKYYFFTKKYVWRYSSKTLDNDYPKKIDEYFQKKLKKIDAITWDPEAGNILIINQKKYWRITINPFKIIKKGVISSLNDTIIAADVDCEGDFRLFGKKYFYQMKKFEDLEQNKFMKRDIKKWFLKC